MQKNIMPTPKLYLGAWLAMKKNGPMKLPRQYPIKRAALVVTFFVCPAVLAVATDIDRVQVAVYENEIQRQAKRL
jgi:hypothetical protein